MQNDFFLGLVSVTSPKALSGASESLMVARRLEIVQMKNLSRNLKAPL
jgi:hypothetical protein